MRQLRERRYDRQVFGLDQRDLPTAESACRGTVVSFKPALDDGHGFAHRIRGSTPGRT
jgi:hypothetical protein